MAMQNTVQLLGKITEILNDDKTKFKLSIKKMILSLFIPLSNYQNKWNI
ncbi:hypothetical protein FHU25_001037 [Clostridium saccharobutylicum]|nr:hypothetical protein [Clostridium saccharobutylicum]